MLEAQDYLYQDYLFISSNESIKALTASSFGKLPSRKIPIWYNRFFTK